jgi:hypothetical protein
LQCCVGNALIERRVARVREENENKHSE